MYNTTVYIGVQPDTRPGLGKLAENTWSHSGSAVIVISTRTPRRAAAARGTGDGRIVHLFVLDEPTCSFAPLTTDEVELSAFVGDHARSVPTAGGLIDLLTKSASRRRVDRRDVSTLRVEQDEVAGARVVGPHAVEVLHDRGSRLPSTVSVFLVIGRTEQRPPDVHVMS